MTLVIIVAAAVVLLALLLRGSRDDIVQNQELRSWERIARGGKP